MRLRKTNADKLIYVSKVVPVNKSSLFIILTSVLLDEREKYTCQTTLDEIQRLIGSS